MKLMVFSLRDVKAGTFLTPMFVPTVGLALRTLSDELNRASPDPSNVLAHHPEDFELFHIGDFETDTGRLAPLSDPVSVMLCTNLKVTGNGQLRP
jgi:hypothetical protein